MLSVAFQLIRKTEQRDWPNGSWAFFAWELNGFVPIAAKKLRLSLCFV